MLVLFFDNVNIILSNELFYTIYVMVTVIEHFFYFLSQFTMVMLSVASVCLSVCNTITFESLHIEMFIVGLNFKCLAKTEDTGQVLPVSRSRSPKKKRVFCDLFGL